MSYARKRFLWWLGLTAMATGFYDIVVGMEFVKALAIGAVTAAALVFFAWLIVIFDFDA